MARQCLEQYLSGQFSWLHCLETMVVALGKELVRNQLICVEVRNEYIGLWKEVSDEKIDRIGDNLDKSLAIINS